MTLEEQKQIQWPGGGGVTYLSGAEGCYFEQVNISQSGTTAASASTATQGLNPILDASHKRNRKTSPPNSICFQGTREEVIREIIAWAVSSRFGAPQHILWVFGYAGCGKSAIAQAVAVQLEDAHRLGASFFFFRGAGDRSRITRLAETIASQISGSIDGTARHIQVALEAHPGLLEPTTSPVVQFKHLVYNPIRAVAGKWYRLNGVWRPFIIVIDGFDECEDKEEVAQVIQDIIELFDRKPGIPLRFIVTSRVEDHLHKKLYKSNQVRLLNLVDRTSDRDISTALDASISDAEDSRVLTTCAGTWLTPEDKQQLIKHIGGSFIFMTTIVRFLFAPFKVDGRTPQDRLPLALDMNPGFDGLYWAILESCQSLPHFSDIVSIIALTRRSLSASEIADFLEIKVVDVVSVLVELHAIVQVPGDDHAPITLWHSSLHDFLNDKGRSGKLSASPIHHEHFTARCIDLAFASTPEPDNPGPTAYARQYVWDHFAAVLDNYDEEERGEGYQAIFTRVQHKGEFLSAASTKIVDTLYRSNLVASGATPYSLEVVAILALMRRPLSVVEIADLLRIEVGAVVGVLVELRAILRVPGDDKTPIKLWYKSLQDFLNDEGRSGPFFATPEHRERLAVICIDLATSTSLNQRRPASLYAKEHVWDHYNAVVSRFKDSGREDAHLAVFARVQRKEDFLASAPAEIANDIYQSTLFNLNISPHCMNILKTVVLVMAPLTITQIADLLDVNTIDVVGMIENLGHLIHLSGDYDTPIALPSSLRAFLRDKDHSGSFFASASHHELITCRCIALAFPMSARPASRYAKSYVWAHYEEAINGYVDDTEKQDLHRAMLASARPRAALLAAAPRIVATGLYEVVLWESRATPHVPEIIRTIAQTKSPLSVAQIAHRLGITVDQVTETLGGLREIVDFSEYIHACVTFRHGPFRDLIKERSRSPPFKVSETISPFHRDTGWGDSMDKDIIIPVVGETGAGKSYFINRVLRFVGQRDAVFESEALTPCTSQIQPVVVRWQPEGYVNAENRRLVLVDCPGFNAGREDDTDLLKRLAEWLKDSYRKGAVLGGIVYLHDISATRSRCRSDDFRKILGHCLSQPYDDKEPRSTVVFVTSKWEYDTEEANQKREFEYQDKYWKDVLKPNDGKRGVRVMRLKPKSKAEPKISPDPEESSAWGVVSSILREV